jgi:hypothetical protein
LHLDREARDLDFKHNLEQNKDRSTCWRIG